MGSQETRISKRRGPTPSGVLGVMVKMRPDALARLDAWIADQPDPKPTRPEALRQLAEQVLLTGHGNRKNMQSEDQNG